jgi:hypothetical protein
MRGGFPPENEAGTPACPSCGSNQRVVRMPDSLTPFERPNMRNQEIGGRYYCQTCAHDFEPEQGNS